MANPKKSQITVEWEDCIPNPEDAWPQREGHVEDVSRHIVVKPRKADIINISAPFFTKKKRLTKRERWERKLAAFVKNNPNPYHRWPEFASGHQVTVEQALNGSQPGTWHKGETARPKLLTVEDLAVGLHAVECVGRKGCSYGQLRCCFRVCIGKGLHDGKASAIFKELLRLDLIEKTGNYSVGKRGNCYEASKGRSGLMWEGINGQQDNN